MYNTADYDYNQTREAMVEHQARIFMEMFHQPYDEAYENAERMIPKNAGCEDNWS